MRRFERTSHRLAIPFLLIVGACVGCTDFGEEDKLMIPQERVDCAGEPFRWLTDECCPFGGTPAECTNSAYCVAECETDADCAGIDGRPYCRTIGLCGGGDSNCNGTVLACRSDDFWICGMP